VLLERQISGGLQHFLDQARVSLGIWLGLFLAAQLDVGQCLVAVSRQSVFLSRELVNCLFEALAIGSISLTFLQVIGNKLILVPYFCSPWIVVQLPFFELKGTGVGWEMCASKELAVDRR
jgi:hypothetical protein